MVTKRLEINGEIICSRVGRFLLIAVWVRHWRRRINTPILILILILIPILRVEFYYLPVG